MLQVSDLTYTYPGGGAPALSGFSFQVRQGECVCITGRSGCGKTTLLMAVKGLLHQGNLEGEIRFNGATLASGVDRSAIGFVFQNAESQILCTTVYDEVAFGPENLCVASQEICRRIGDALDAVCLTAFGDRNVERFSAGQKHRLAIASVLSMEPRMLLLDEPTAQLDSVGKEELAAVLRGLKSQGMTLVIVEHNLLPFVDLADRFLVMEEGRLKEASESIPDDCLPPPVASRSVRSGSVKESSPAVIVGNLSHSYPETGEVLRNVSLTINRGELVHLYGINGSGKSTFLRCLAGISKPDRGTVEVAGVRGPHSGRLLGKVGYLFQNPQRQLFEDTVFDEVAFALRKMRMPKDRVQSAVSEALHICEAGHLAERLPLSLSFGEQHRVTLASVIAPRPEVLLLDEPFAGLDVRQRRRFLSILTDIRDQYGTAVLIASHDPLPDPAWPDRALFMEGGAVEEN
ncbi:MAG: ATP-binding cassette domain-containing protein [Geobacteraceae bacterium]|nr:ATP-binding cassette domain-containing protein [Geobacteraceae bacterium]